MKQVLVLISHTYPGTSRNGCFVYTNGLFCADGHNFHTLHNMVKRAFQYAAFILWEGVSYRKRYYRCVENGVRSLFPPLDGKTMGYKEEE